MMAAAWLGWVPAAAARNVAVDDFYLTSAGATFAVPAPGILTNDTGGPNLTTKLLTRTADGALTLNSDGSFNYTPSNGFAGVDGFIYEAGAGPQMSAPASAVIMVTAPQELFHDDFSRPTNGVFLPWSRSADGNMVTGSWAITNGMMAGSGPAYSYGYAYAGNTNWTNYAVQARIRFSAVTAASAGVLGRLNPVTGAHYALWVYPEQSDEYNIPPLNGIPRLWLIKYSSWTNFTFIGQWSSLAAIGTNWHTIKLAFQGNTLLGYFDGALVTNVTDDGRIDGTAAYANGAAGLNMWQSTAPIYTFSADDFIVTTGSVATNPPTITAISFSNNLVSVTWLSTVGATYRLQYNDNIDTTNWQDVSPDVTATGSTASQTNSAGGVPGRYYRVKFIGS